MPILTLHDPVAIFATIMAITLIAPIIMHTFRIPGIIGLILAGAIVGPGGIHLLDRDSTIVLLGTVGLLYMMFVAGLSLDLHSFKRRKLESIAFGLVSFLIPQIIAISVGLYLLEFSLVSSVLLGSIAGSHTLLAYPITRHLGISKNRSVTVAVGGTIITDSLSLIVLAGVVASLQGNSSTTFWSKFILLVLLFFLLAFFVIPHIGRWFFKNVPDRGHSDFSFLLVILFATALLSTSVGLAPIIGAFTAGLVMNRLVPDGGTLMNRIHFTGEALFIPFFLISIGMLIDYSVLFSSLTVWRLAAIFIGIVIIGKLLASIICGIITKRSIHEIATVAGLTIPQAAATLAVTLIGFELNIFDQNIVNAVVILMLVSCFIGTVVTEKAGRRVALIESKRDLVKADLPQRILVPLANDQTAPRLLDLAFALKSQENDEPIFPLSIARDGISSEREVALAEKLLNSATEHALAAAVTVVPLTRLDLHIPDGILRAIREQRISTVVIGWNGFVSTREKILGSILDELIEDSSELLLVYRSTAIKLNITTRIVLVIPEFSELEPGFEIAIRDIKNLAARLAVEILILTSENTQEKTLEMIATIKPKVKINFQVTQSLAHMLRTLGAELKEEDLILLLSTRIDRISWTSQLDTLPRRIAGIFPTNNFITIFPPENESDPIRSNREKFFSKF